MNHQLQTSLAELTAIQRQAVNWNQGALLVLAGPGSGKTRVLTCRIAHLLNESPDQRFRVLALTFTNKAADEMNDRVRSFVPELQDRVNISTFHSFCSKILRQHGVHIGLKPNFRIYSRLEDRKALLRNAIRRDSNLLSREAHQLLPWIDRMKAQLIGPRETESHIEKSVTSFHENPQLLATAYRLYEEELRQANALDFNSLIFEAYKLFNHSVLAQHYQTVYKHWLIDEFQDTNEAQYKLLKRMSASDFREVFAVADDDQTIYEWNGANVRRISSLASDFSCDVIQLPTNFRCPPQIVAAANRLVVYNVKRLKNKSPSASSQQESSRGIESIQCRVFPTDQKEVTGIVSEIADMDNMERSQTAVLARNRSLLQSIHDGLEAKGVFSSMLMRRDDFVSPKMRWLVACLRQIDRPLDRHNLATLISIFENIASVPMAFEDIISHADANNSSYLSIWIDTAQKAELPPCVADAINVITKLVNGDIKLSSAINELIDLFGRETDDPDLQEDLSAWRKLAGTVDLPGNSASLGQFIQELDLRSKDPNPKPGSVSLATIHGAKGLEFNTVYLMGLAEEILPSWHSIQKNNGNAALEEERRACFVAITRTKKHLILSRADQYKGHEKRPSRFLKEMGLLDCKMPSPVNLHTTQLA